MLDHSSLLSTNLWDMRAAVEAQLRLLTTIHRSVDGFTALAPMEARNTERTVIVRNLQEIGRLVRSVEVAVADAIKRVSIELTDL